MFSAAVAFNQDVSQWDVSKVKYTGGMFYRASAFNQNLCVWGSKLGDSVVFYDWEDGLIFDETACPSPSVPKLLISTPGPFCWAC